MSVINRTLAGLVSLINDVLVHDPATRARLTSLSGKRFLFVITGPYAASVLLEMHNDRVALSVVDADEAAVSADVVVEGALSSLCALAQKKNLSRSGLDQPHSACSIRGDVTLLMELQAIVRDLDVNWQDPLASVVGDGPAHGLRTLSNHFIDSGKQLVKALKGNTKVALSEWSIAPDELAWEKHCQAIHDLVQRVNRATARVDDLSDQLLSKPKGKTAQ